VSEAQDAVGIDLGTTNSLIALDRAGTPWFAPTPEGDHLTPSCIYYGENGAILVGKQAIEAGLQDPERFFQHWKRDMGDTGWHRRLGRKTVTPVLLSSFVLKKLLEDARVATGIVVKDAVITVPAYFGDLERGATLDAARIAGIEHARALNEPTAAALAFGLDPEQRSSGVHRALVYDLGGGTFDVTVVELEAGRVRVVATAGEHRLGGKDWDDELMNLVAEQVYAKMSVDPREDDRVLAVLRGEVERAKHVLSLEASAVVTARLPADDRTLDVAVTRDAFEARTRGLLQQTETQLQIVLERAKLGWNEIDAVLPVGGATRMPAVQALLRRLTGKVPLTILHPEEAVARGACAYASLVARGAELAVEMDPDATPDTIVGLLPGAAGEKVTPFRLDEEVVGLLPGKRRVVEVQDVVSHSLGVLVNTKKGFKNAVLIKDQTPIPVERKRSFVTVKPDQTIVFVKILEGDDPDPEGCTLIGTLVVDGLPAGRPRGQRIEVSYRYDEDGRVQVSAKDVATKKAARATIQRQGALERSEIKRLRQEVAAGVVR
jgi:molecular chaperone DnaK